MAGTLEQPRSIAALYMARRDEVNPHRPLMQGDVFETLEMPGFEDSAGAIILTHPCSMRRGPKYVDRFLMARVVPYRNVPLEDWPSKHQRHMLLPDLKQDGKPWAAPFEDVGVVASAAVAGASRIACLDPYGLTLLQQRFVYYLTRYVAPLNELHSVCDPVLVEAELLEDWLDSAATAGADLGDAEVLFDELMRADRDGSSLQEDLKTPAQQAAVRRIMAQEAEEKYG